MKYYLLFLTSFFVLASCNFTEEITFNEDGSGEFVMHYDMSQIMKELEKQGLGEKKKEGAKKIKMDSTVYFKDLLVEKADSIATLSIEEQDKLKALETTVMKMKMDEEQGIMQLGFGATFTSFKDLHKAFEKMKQLKDKNSQDNPMYNKMGESGFGKVVFETLEYVDFSYNGNTFKRQLKDNYNPSKEDMDALNKEMKELDQMGDEFKSLFGSMTYNLKYNFPKKIKSVSNKNASISNHRKTLTITQNLLEMIKDPKHLDLVIILED